MEPQEYDEILRTLVRIAAHQDTINEGLRESIQELRESTRQQVAINQAVQTTQARIETLLARMLRTDTNGQDA